MRPLLWHHENMLHFHRFLLFFLSSFIPVMPTYLLHVCVQRPGGTNLRIRHTDVMDSVMPCGKVLQTVGAHYLGQTFAKVFDINFMNKQAKPELAYMTCYGVSTRLLAATVAAHGDKKGLVIPAVIAPKQVRRFSFLSFFLSFFCSYLLLTSTRNNKQVVVIPIWAARAREVPKPPRVWQPLWAAGLRVGSTTARRVPAIHSSPGQ